jgi:hypothetical protein
MPEPAEAHGVSGIPSPLEEAVALVHRGFQRVRQSPSPPRRGTSSTPMKNPTRHGSINAERKTGQLSVDRRFGADLRSGHRESIKFGAVGASPDQSNPDGGGCSMPQASLFEPLGGVFAIAAVVDHFSDAVVQNPIVGQP